MKNIYKIFIVSLLMGGLFFSCETTELDLADNPNALTPDQGDVNLFINSIQLGFAGGVEGINGLGAAMTRIEQFAGRDYLNSLQPGTLNGFWGSAYPGIFEDIAQMTPLAEAGGFRNHLGVARTLQAYYLVSLVDVIGDVPFTEANNALAFPLPGVDSGTSVYAAALDLLNQALSDFAQESDIDLDNDFFYDNDFDNWSRLANTMRMRIFLQTRLVDADAISNFNAVVNSGNFIQSNDQDFQFSWGNNFQQPNTRHPNYNTDYTTTGGGSYRSNWLMNLMQMTGDTRIRYYFFRQIGCTPGASCLPEGSEEELACSLQMPPQHYIDAGFGDNFCFLENGYWGRDHGDNNGIPPDGFARTVWGIYPSGGLLDGENFRNGSIGLVDEDDPSLGFEFQLDESDDGVGQEVGALGAGISPFLLASFVDFWRAEIALVNGQTGTASNFIADGLAKSIAKVQNTDGTGVSDPSFDSGALLDDTVFDEDTGMIDPDSGSSLAGDFITANITGGGNQSFIDSITMAFDNGALEDQWNILAEQYFVTLYGAGIDAYNFYRRTGFPNTLQPNIEPDPGNFPRSLFYPLSEASSNSNITQKGNLDVQVFWDNNPASPGFPASN